MVFLELILIKVSIDSKTISRIKILNFKNIKIISSVCEKTEKNEKSRNAVKKIHI